MKTPNTAELFATLRAAYPDKDWSLEPYTAHGVQREAIMFNHQGTSIHDPTASDCGRFVADGCYGLSDEHARLMRRHNLPYENAVLGATYDLAALYQSILQTIKNEPNFDVEEFLADYGFFEHGTGGNCRA